MNREIKFRAWDASDSEKPYMLGPYEIKDSIFNHKDVRSLELMQCTGLKDKNGKEVYEGDILKRGSESKPFFYLLVSFNANLGFVGTTYPGQNHTKPLSYMMTYEGAAYTEIIGNIYENPELLK